MDVTAKFMPWLSGLGAAVTMGLTLYNADTKKKIDEAEVRLKQVQADVAAKGNLREDLKEKVSRYTWIRSLFPDLVDEKDERKRNFTISLLRQMLEENEAAELFTSLKASSSRELQAVGSSGLKVIQNEQAAELGKKISLINADTPDVRKRAVAALIDRYKSSSDAISIVTSLYDESRIDSLSPSGIINGIVFLNATDSYAWNIEQISAAEDFVKRLRTKNIGPQTKSVIETLEKHLMGIKSTQQK